MKKLAGLLMVLTLAGCAQIGGGDAGSSSVGATPVETESRSRAKAFTELAGAYFARGQMKVALDEVRKAIQSDSGYGPAYNVLGLIYMELAEDKLAEENFRKAIDLDRADSESHNNYGWFLCVRARYDEGLNQFSDALRNPLYAKPEQAMTNAALCNEKKGDLKQAEAYYKKALKLQPDHGLAIVKLAELNFRQGNLNEAQRLLTRHQEVASPTAESLWLGVRMERKRGDRSQEAAYNLQLRKRFPDSPEAQMLTRGQYE